MGIFEKYFLPTVSSRDYAFIKLSYREIDTDFVVPVLQLESHKSDVENVFMCVNNNYETIKKLLYIRVVRTQKWNPLKIVFDVQTNVSIILF